MNIYWGDRLYKEEEVRIIDKKRLYRYDTYFAIPVQGSAECNKRLNYYIATLVVRKTINGLFLYDMINIKKEASTPLESK